MFGRIQEMLDRFVYSRVYSIQDASLNRPLEYIKVPLTDAKIKALTPAVVRYLVADGNGLNLEVLPSGKLSWIFRYRLRGKPEKVAIGRYPEMSLKRARE